MFYLGQVQKIEIFCEKNVEFLYVTTSGTYSNRLALKG